MKGSTRNILILMLIMIVLTGVSIAVKLPNGIKINGTELHNYDGQSLSSINDFYENSIKGPQYINSKTYRLQITGLVQTQKNYTIEDVINNHTSIKKVSTLSCVEGWSVKILWEGVLVKDLINENNPDPNATTIIFKAYDGYTTSFPISYIMNNQIILAYKMNNVTLPPERGYPFQLVAEGKWGYKWIKWVMEINVSNDGSYRGYWESQGYSNSGDLGKNFIGP